MPGFLLDYQRELPQKKISTEYCAYTKFQLHIVSDTVVIKGFKIHMLRKTVLRRKYAYPTLCILLLKVSMNGRTILNN